MRAIIAGGRDFVVGPKQRRWLDGVNAALHKPITEVVSGKAPGADAGGERWAKSRGIPVKGFPADWSKGRGAGPARNRKMAEYLTPLDADNVSDVVILFPGGKGTANMKETAGARCLHIIEYKDLET